MDIPVFAVLFKVVQKQFKSISYMDMFRKVPAMYYRYEPFADSVGNNGEDVMSYLCDHGKDMCNLRDYYEGSLTITQMTTLWLERILDVEVTFEWVDRGKEYSGSILVNGKNHIYSGTAVNQLLPIIVGGLTDSSVFIVKYPETCLNPRAIINMTDYFIFLAKNGKQVIIETNSYDIVQMMEYHALKDEDILNMLQIQFIEKDKDVSKVTSIEIIPDWGLSKDTPEDFFSQFSYECQIIFNVVQDNLRKH